MAKRAARLATTIRLRTFRTPSPWGPLPRRTRSAALTIVCPIGGAFCKYKRRVSPKQNPPLYQWLGCLLPAAIAAPRPVIAARTPPAHPAAAPIAMAADIGDVFHGRGAVDGGLDARRRANGHCAGGCDRGACHDGGSGGQR